MVSNYNENIYSVFSFTHFQLCFTKVNWLEVNKHLSLCVAYTKTQVCLFYFLLPLNAVSNIFLGGGVTKRNLKKYQNCVCAMLIRLFVLEKKKNSEGGFSPLVLLPRFGIAIIDRQYFFMLITK